METSEQEDIKVFYPVADEVGGIPPHFLKELEEYFNERKLKTSGFIKAMLTNDLGSAIRWAPLMRCGLFGTDVDPTLKEFDVMSSIYWALVRLAPKCAWGSKQAVEDWLVNKVLINTPVQALFSPIDTSLLDDLIDAGYPLKALSGRMIDYHGTITMAEQIHGRIKLPTSAICHKCRSKKIDVWAVSGLHKGAWCYIVDMNDNFIANIRDQVWTCTNCKQQNATQESPETLKI